MASLTRAEIERLLDLLNEELRAAPIRGEVYLAGGAVMCLAYGARESTRDVDAWFRPAREVREAAARVGARAGVDERWLNDGVKAYLSPAGTFSPYRELSHLKVYCADAAYVLAMKCLAMRIGEEFRDEDDVRYLLRTLDLRSYDDAIEQITRYYPIDDFPPKARYVLEEILGT